MMAGPRESACAKIARIANEGINVAMTNPSETVNISAQLVKELRERTGAGFSDCRSALVEAHGNLEVAIDVLRKKGQAAAQKKAARQATEGAEKVEYVDTSAYESYEKQEGDFIEPVTEPGSDKSLKGAAE